SGLLTYICLTRRVTHTLKPLDYLLNQRTHAMYARERPSKSPNRATDNANRQRSIECTGIPFFVRLLPSACSSFRRPRLWRRHKNRPTREKVSRTDCRILRSIREGLVARKPTEKHYPDDIQR